MRFLWITLCTLTLAWPSLALAGAKAAPEAGPMNRTRMTLEQRVGGEVFQKAGLAKLTPEEQWALADWLENYTRQITAYMDEQGRHQAGAKPTQPKP